MRSSINSLIVVVAIIGFIFGILKTGMSILGHGHDSWVLGVSFGTSWLLLFVFLYFAFNFLSEKLDKRK